MAYDTSARPSDFYLYVYVTFSLRKNANGVQYAEILVTGKTKSRTLPLIFSLPYLKTWIQIHPHGTNTDSWLFISFSKQNNLGRITRDGLLKRYEQYYKKRFFLSLLKLESIIEKDKDYIRIMLMKSFFYIFLDI